MAELMMTLASLPREAGAVPRGFRMRPFAPGDRELWADIQAGTGCYGSASAALFDREFGDDAVAHAERILFVEAHGEAVGVTAAWFPGEGVPATAGRVHWVAVRPSHQRRGLGRVLVLHTLWRLRGLGYETAYLTTGSGNLPAIHLYRRLGFAPAPRTDEECAAWEALAS